MDIVKAERLQPGDVVGIISPSEPVTEELRPQFERAVQVLEKEFGLRVKLGRHVFEQHYYNAGTREARIEDFNEMWSDPEVRMLMMSQGGETANHLLDGLDYELFRSQPKIFAGISDGTTLLNAIHARSGLVTYHGPDLLWTFGRKVSRRFRDNFYRTFFEGETGPLEANDEWFHQERPEERFDGRRCLKAGTARGLLAGGHLGCLCTTALAGYAPSFKDKILFVEGTDEIGELDRQLTSLRLGGKLDGIRGLVLGWFEGSRLRDPRKDRDVGEMISEALGRQDIPIMQIGELGHNVENYVLPIGCRAYLDSAAGLLRIEEPCVEQPRQ